VSNHGDDTFHYPITTSSPALPHGLLPPPSPPRRPPLVLAQESTNSHALAGDQGIPLHKSLAIPKQRPTRAISSTGDIIELSAAAPPVGPPTAGALPTLPTRRHPTSARGPDGHRSRAAFSASHRLWPCPASHYFRIALLDGIRKFPQTTLPAEGRSGGWGFSTARSPSQKHVQTYPALLETWSRLSPAHPTRDVIARPAGVTALTAAVIPTTPGRYLSQLPSEAQLLPPLPSRPPSRRGARVRESRTSGQPSREPHGCSGK
jgi:hypothetical protein